jgi:cytochrome b6-f complex iron-sulfur subunit
MENENVSRRAFLNRVWLVLGTVAFAELVAIVITFFRPRKPRTALEDLDAIIVAGPVDNFEPGTVTAFVRGKFYLARLEDGGFLAMSRSCTHLSCTVPWVSEENKFICPCHSSAFDIAGGVVSPPAPRALDLLGIKIENSVVKVDTSKLRKRSEFSADQVTYAKKT